MKAIWNDQVIAESNDTVMIEGNHYFPIESIKKEFLKESQTQTVCHWKGTASYYSLEVNGKENTDAAWFYPQPMEMAKAVNNRVAFWRGVKIED